MTKQYTAAQLAKHKALTEKYSGRPQAKTKFDWFDDSDDSIPARNEREELDVFGKPKNKVSPRVQRIRDLKAGKRTGTVVRPSRDIWNNNHRDTRPMTVSKPTETPNYSKLMSDALNKAADYEDK